MNTFNEFPACLGLTLVDIGAAEGIHPRWGSLSNPNLSVLMVEPEADAFSKLVGDSAGRIKATAVALSSEPGTRTLFVAKKGRCSSFQERNFDFVDLFPNKERFEIIRKDEIETHTLDGICASQGIPAADFIKIDVEGHEHAVIAGGQKCFSDAIGIEAEMVFAPIYKGGAHFCDQHKSYTEMGFELYDLQRYYWKRDKGRTLPSPGQLIYCNGLYLKTPERVLSESHTDSRRVAATLRIYATFGLYDLVETLRDLASEAGMIDDELQAMVSAELSKRRYTKARQTRAGLLHRILIKLSDVTARIARKIEPTERERDYFSADQNLGH